MNPESPVLDDTPIWDALLGLYNAPAICAALELEVFEALREPSSVAEVTERLGYSLRGMTALLGLLKARGFLDRHQGKYRLNTLSRTYMLKESPYCWANFFKFTADSLPTYKILLENVRDGRTAEERRAAQGWESGQMDPQFARTITDYMHCHSIAPAVGLTRTADFSTVKRLLDVGGGSGCYAAALANRYPDLRCTVMELPPICAVAEEYIERAGVSGRVSTQAVDMFREPWPGGYDAHFFANVFHDWSFAACEELAAKSHAALEPGGRIFLQEMLLDETGDGPWPAAAFSLLMTIGTNGQQFTLAQLESILEAAGFSQVRAQRSYGYYSLVSAEKGAA